MKKRIACRLLALCAAALFLASGCQQRGAQADAGGEGASPAGQSQPAPTPAAGEQPNVPETEEPAADVAAGPSYIEGVAAEVAAAVAQPGMGEYERAKAAFDYMIANTALVEPVGLDLWRIRGGASPQPDFVENRSLSALLFGAGMCEDYAAAFTMLLRAMGLEAEYVPGLTYSSEGALVDHAWVIAKIDGVWYHLDCQLEDNISRHGAIRYLYFMKSDATMRGSHRWGQNLIDARLLTEAQNEEIAQSHLMPACPQDYPTPARQPFEAAPLPDTGALRREIDAELRAYETAHGPLEPLELNIIPPVFGLEGYGPPD